MHHLAQHQPAPRPDRRLMFAPPIIWKRSSRAKRLSLRIDTQQKAVVVTLPPHASRKQGLALLYSQTDWISQTLADLPPSALERGQILLKGRYYPLLEHPEPTIIITNTDIKLGGKTAEEKCRLLRTFLHQYATTALQSLVHHYGSMMGHLPTKITLRDTRSRWGSCTRQKRLMLSWRLIMAPDDIARYVVVHELAHLKHFNHGPNFWAYVDRFCPGGKKGRINAEKWLHQNGILLMRMV